MVSYLIDAFLAIMLVTTTGYLLIVNRRLKVLRSGQSEINGLISAFARTIDETDASVKRLVGAASDVAGKLGHEVDRGSAMKDEVGRLLTSCERTASRLDEQLRHARVLLRRLDDMAVARTPRQPVDADGAELVEDAPAGPPAVPAAEPPASEARAAEGPAPERGDDLRAEPAFRPLAPADPPSRPRTERTSSVTAGEFYATLRTVSPRP